MVHCQVIGLVRIPFLRECCWQERAPSSVCVPRSKSVKGIKHKAKARRGNRGPRASALLGSVLSVCSSSDARGRAPDGDGATDHAVFGTWHASSVLVTRRRLSVEGAKRDSHSSMTPRRGVDVVAVIRRCGGAKISGVKTGRNRRLLWPAS